ncbi:hypothetical protein HRbin04_00494 [archaeon HR04]|nr:hypothetical protein HRbin04_00494 [archaeon HR04]
MPSIAGKPITISALAERLLKGGENTVEWDNSAFKWVYQISKSLNMRIWTLTIVEPTSIGISSSVYTNLFNAYKNNSTLSFVLDLPFHNLGALTVKVYSPPTVSYSNTDKGTIRVINVELIEAL